MPEELRTHIPWPCDDPGPWAGVWLESVGYRDCSRFNADDDPFYYCTHLIAKGKVHFRAINGVDVVLGPDDLFSMWPHIQWELFAAPPFEGEEIEIDWIRLKGPLAGEFMRLLGTTEDRPWARAAEPEEARTLMHELQVLATDYPEQADLTAISMLHRLAAACAPFNPEPVGDRPLARRIREAMDQHIGSGMNVTDYARAFRMSRSNLFLLFKDTFGKSPVQVLNDIRLERAKALLKNTDMSIAEVAFASGYRDPLYFSRKFRKITGKPPSGFRKRARRAMPPPAVASTPGAKT
jgi:AraC-like DNA-binding protein